ncbi:MAG: hypothetical protein EXR99_08930 [Gemmataceae bacterium]|nr:hypothetical protein [Gemmataceae bacterium]
MSFDSICPKCQKRFRVAQTALGSLMECSGCFQEFRVVPCAAGSAASPAEVVKKEASAGESGLELLQAMRGEKPVEEPNHPEPPSYLDRGQRLTGGKPLENVPGLIALSLGLVALGTAQIPFVEYLVGPLTVGAIIVALIAAVLCQGGLVTRLTLPGVALLVAIPTLVILVKDPHWFRNKPYDTEAELPRDKFLLFSPGNRPFLPEKEGQAINAKQYDIQRNDIRVGIGDVRYRVADYVQANQKKRTRDPKIHILLRVNNCGLENAFEFPAWKEYGEIKLFDQSGLELKEWERPKGTVEKTVTTRPVFPGQNVDEEIIFDPPKEKFTELKLELPAKAFGEKEGKVTFLLPLSLITR